MNVWEDGTNQETICAHYGYADTGQSVQRGYWPKETVMERIALIPEYLRLSGLEKKRFRLVLDYDPDFPRALISIHTEGRTTP